MSRTSVSEAVALPISVLPIVFYFLTVEDLSYRNTIPLTTAYRVLIILCESKL